MGRGSRARWCPNPGFVIDIVVDDLSDLTCAVGLWKRLGCATPRGGCITSFERSGECNFSLYRREILGGGLEWNGVGWWNRLCRGCLDLFIFRVEADELLVGKAVAEIVAGAGAVGTCAGGLFVQANHADLPEITCGLVVALMATE